MSTPTDDRPGVPVAPPTRRHPDDDPPIWRRDFPITSSGEDAVTRREFVRYLALASGGFAAGNVGVALWSSLRSIAQRSRRTVASVRAP